MTGCSFGGYHAVNFALKHPRYREPLHQHERGVRYSSIPRWSYYDDDAYFNSPQDYVSNMNDDWYLSRYRQMKIVLASGEWDMCLDQNVTAIWRSWKRQSRTETGWISGAIIRDTIGHSGCGWREKYL